MQNKTQRGENQHTKRAEGTRKQQDGQRSAPANRNGQERKAPAGKKQR